MEVPLRMFARVRRPRSAASGASVQVEGRWGVRAADGRLFPVEAAVDADADPSLLYSAVGAPQVNCFLEGCDTSVVVFGQAGTGKTLALFGPETDRIRDGDDDDRGLVQRFLWDAFQILDETPERGHVVHLTWTRIVGGAVVDLLGCGLAKCSGFDEAMRYIAKGRANECRQQCHTVFTISIEQKWIGPGGVLHHRLPTASFCELSAHPEPSLVHLEAVIGDLLRTNDPKMVDYERSLLTTMLRDSFGGRAFTWVICCLDAEPSRTAETLKTLELSWCCRGIRNFVTVIGFADNDTPLNVDKKPNRGDGYFGLQFATQQWIKLVSNAEGLFRKILHSNSLSKIEMAQINEWLFLKAECDECLDPASATIGDGPDEPNEVVEKNALPRIAEDTEPSEPSDSDGDSDASLQHDDFLFTDKLCKYMEYFREKTDELAFDKCEEYLHYGAIGDQETSDTCMSEMSVPMGRRKTIRPGESISGDELELLRKAAADAVSPESRKIILESHKTLEDPEPKLVQRELLKMIDSPVPSESCKKLKNLLQKYNLKNSLILKLSKNIQDGEIQLKGLIGLCIAKEQLIQDLSKIVKRQNTVKQYEKHSNLNEEFKKAKVDLITAQAKLLNDQKNHKSIQAVQKYKAIADELEKRLMEQELGKRLESDNNKEIKKHENKLKAYKKQIDQLKKQIKRDEKRKNTLELELIKDKSKLDEMRNHEISNGTLDSKSKDKKQHSLKQVSVRLSHLDHILKEKTIDLQKCELSEDKESMLRREIRNLRKTRECLIDQRCVLGHKRKIQRSLSDTEERKLIEYEEAIEAIDTAIEYKNELICGRGQMVINAGEHRERGEELLMARLSKLSNNEMRTLLYKYFQKVIDLRTTCTALEAAAGAAQQDAGGWRRRCADAWAALQHARLAHARRTTTLTARHYHTMNQIMNELHGDIDSDNSHYNGVNNHIPLPLEYPHQMNHRMLESDLENVMTQHSRIASTTAKIKVRDNVVEGNTRVLNRIQVARFHQSGIPSQNLRQLQLVSDPTTKVTRQKNKLVITQEDKTNK